MKVSFDKETHLSDIERPTKESKTMNTSFMKIFAKNPKFGNKAGWHPRTSAFRSSTITDIMVDTLKFTSESKVWNNFCAGCSINEMPRHLSSNLY